MNGFIVEVAGDRIIVRSNNKGRIVRWYVYDGSYAYKGMQLAVIEVEGRGGVVLESPDKAGRVILVHRDAGCFERGDLLIELEKVCSHEDTYEGMCTECGESVSVRHFSEVLSYKELAAPIHGMPTFRISKNTASKMAQEDLKHLLDAKKLPLIIDLDQTLIHTTVQPFAEEYYALMRGRKHPSDEMHKVRLPDSNTDYYVKLRPHMREFLSAVSKLFELHVYTMGTRDYAMAIAKVIDPAQHYFSDRILSRADGLAWSTYSDVSYSTTEFKTECLSHGGSASAIADKTRLDKILETAPHRELKTSALKMIFPTNEHLCVILDDRSDVWNDIDNLIQVKPYTFFKDADDMNSLHGKSGVGGNKTELSEILEKPNNTNNKKRVMDSELEDDGPIHSVLAAVYNEYRGRMGQAHGDRDSRSRNTDLIQVRGMDLHTCVSILDDCLSKRRFANAFHHLDLIQEAHSSGGSSCDDEVGAYFAAHSDGGGDAASACNVLFILKRLRSMDVTSRPVSIATLDQIVDNDTSLVHIERVLQDVHAAYYGLYDNDPGFSVAKIIVDLRRDVLAGVCISFSGLVPINTDFNAHAYVKQARLFGATVEKDFTDYVTHLITVNTASEKINLALKTHDCTIVHVDWFFACIDQWAHLEEAHFPVSPSIPVYRPRVLYEESETSGDDDSEEDDGLRKRTKLSDGEDEGSSTEFTDMNNIAIDIDELENFLMDDDHGYCSDSSEDQS